MMGMNTTLEWHERREWDLTYKNVATHMGIGRNSQEWDLIYGNGIIHIGIKWA